jgi:acyl-CoA hydrolase
MVAIDEDGKPVQVPGLKVETINEQAEWEAGKKRHDLRKKRRVEGF